MIILSMKKRKIGYTYGSVSGHFSFRKLKSIAFESTLERDFLRLLEFNDSVSDIVGQPFTLEYTNNNGVKTKYTPDFLVHFNEPDASLSKIQRKSLLVEVKPKDKLSKEFAKYRERFKIAVKYAQSNDMIFKIYDESRIRNPYLKNIIFLKRYKLLPYSKTDEDNILSYVNAVGDISIINILEYLYITKEQKSIALGQIWNMLAKKKLLCHFGEELNKQTIVWINDTIEMEALL